MEIKGCRCGVTTFTWLLSLTTFWRPRRPSLPQTCRETIRCAHIHTCTQACRLICGEACLIGLHAWVNDTSSRQRQFRMQRIKREIEICMNLTVHFLTKYFVHCEYARAIYVHMYDCARTAAVHYLAKLYENEVKHAALRNAMQ